MEMIMNDNDSKAFLKEVARVYPKYKDNFGAVSNLIVLLMEELQEERKGRKRGEKFEAMWEEYDSHYGRLYLDISDSAMPINSEYVSTHRLMDETRRKYFPKPKSRWQRINDMLEVLNTVGASPGREELIGLLIELRDEEG